MNELLDRMVTIKLIAGQIDRRLEGLEATDSQLGAALVFLACTKALEAGPHVTETLAPHLRRMADMVEQGGRDDDSP